MFKALGKFCFRYRWAAIAVWIVVFAASAAALPVLSHALQGVFADTSAPNQQASRLIQQKFGQGSTNLLVVFKSGSLNATSEEFQSAEATALSGLTPDTIPHLSGILTYANTGSVQLISSDGKSSVAALSFDAQIETVQQEVASVRDALKDTGLTAYVTGEPAVNADLLASSLRDLRRVEIYGMPVALIALIFIFGSLVAAALPVITGGLALVTTLGVMYLLGHAMSLSVYAMNAASLLGLAIAIDYALFMVTRFREELHKGHTVEEAVVTASRRAGRSIFFSGVAVMTGVVGLLFFPIPGLRSMGIGDAIVVFFSVVASLTFLPALLSVMGRRVNSLAVIRLHEVHASRFWRSWSRLVLRRRWVTVFVAVFLIALVASPVLKMKLEMTSAATLPQALESRRGLDVIDQEFDKSALSPTSVLVTWGGNPTIDMARAATLFAYAEQLSTTPGVASVISPFSNLGVSDPAGFVALWPQFERLLNDPNGFVVPAKGIALPSGQVIGAEQLSQFKQLTLGSVTKGAVLFRVVSQDSPASSEAQNLAERLMQSNPGRGYTVHIAGESAYNYDFFHELKGWFPWVLAWVLLTSLVVFVILLRSVLVPIVAVVVNALTIGMCYGLLVLVFQGGTFAGLLRFTSTGAIEAIVIVVMLCVLFGVTMDYAVFLLTRIHESWTRTHDSRKSVETGLSQTGRVIVSAAALVVIVTGAFVFTTVKSTKMLGVGFALAIIVDTFLVRMMLLPAVTSCLGGASWWWPSRRIEKPAPAAAEQPEDGLAARPISD